jgi:hypothetical protein
MTHADHADVIRSRVVEVVRTMQRTPEGPEYDALADYRDQLAAAGRAIEQSPPPAMRTPTSTLTSSPAPELTIEL